MILSLIVVALVAGGFLLGWMSHPRDTEANPCMHAERGAD